ncbi:MAG: glycine dehydrogenase, partial [gamma proteobacterium symbiont of Taylorina sp.]|nr:glycine dehydrogenase [gamma proteobacterium symbiont of Taylorina sp.]
GADIAVGEGQPLGIPLSSGGPYIGFMACKQKLVRQLPGRIVGRTVDMDGLPGFTLTLQAREQHIRRSKATSNICTNQGLMATAATLYLSLLGADGLQKVAAVCIENTATLIALLENMDGLSFPFGHRVFHEFVIALDVSVDKVLNELAYDNVVGGTNISSTSENLMLICVTETKTKHELEYFAKLLQEAIGVVGEEEQS